MTSPHSFSGRPVPTPIVLATASFALGIAAGALLGVPAPLARWFSLVVAGMEAVLFRCRTRRGIRIGFLALSIGVARGSTVESHLPLRSTPAGPVELTGIVVSVPVEKPGMPAMRTLFELKTALPEAPSLIVIVEDAVAASVRPADRVRLSGSLLPPRRVRNPGERIRHGSRPYFYVPAGDLVQVLRAARPGETGVSFLKASVLRIRATTHQTVSDLYSGTSRGVVLALLLGDRRLLEDGFCKALRDSGTFHFLAISGLHAGIFLAVLLREIGRTSL